MLTSEGLQRDLPEEGNFARMDDGADDPVERLRRLIEARGPDSVHVLRHWMDDRKETP
jgi:hypothetical protein